MFTEAPKFNCNRMGDCISVTLNIPMTRAVIDLFGDDPLPHELSLVNQLQNLLAEPLSHELLLVNQLQNLLAGKKTNDVLPANNMQFNCSRMVDCICLNLSIPMAKAIASIANEFDDGMLKRHEYSLLRQLNGLSTFPPKKMIAS